MKHSIHAKVQIRCNGIVRDTVNIVDGRAGEKHCIEAKNEEEAYKLAREYVHNVARTFAESTYKQKITLRVMDLTLYPVRPESNKDASKLIGANVKRT